MYRNLLNAFMAISFLILMNYRFTGNLQHEILGVIFLLLAVCHSSLNLHWYRTFFKEKQNIYRLLGNLVNILFVWALLMTIFSGLLISQSLFPSTALRVGNTLWIHDLHQGSSYASFILMGIHLGVHWEMIWLRLKRWLDLERFGNILSMGSHFLSVLIILYGVYASFANHIGSMLMMQHVFGAWGKAVPSTVSLFMDYLAIFGCYATITCYITSWMRSGK